MKPIAILLTLIIVMTALPVSAASDQNSVKSTSQKYDEYIAEDYSNYLKFYGYNGTMSESDINVDISRFTTDGIKAEIKDGYVRTDELGSISWKFQVANQGFYNIKVGYRSDTEGNSEILRTVKLDGETPYQDLQHISFERCFDNNMSDPEIINGNEMRSESVELHEWTDCYLSDSECRTLSPCIIFLSAGEHTITFETEKEPLLNLRSINFCSAPKVQKYSDVEKDYQKRAYTGKSITYQAERTGENVVAIYKSCSSIETVSDYTSAYSVPYHPYRTRLNTIGSNRWQTVGEKITWKINVKKAGAYALSLRCRQSSNHDSISYRSILINGKRPYQEAGRIGFEYSVSFKNQVIQVDGKTALFDLNAGTNTISMTVVPGSMSKPIAEVSNALDAMNDLYRNVVQITGVSPDSFVDYDICKKVPDFTKIMKEESDRLYSVIDYIYNLTGEKGSRTAQLEKMAIQAKSLAKNPNDVVNQISLWKNNISSLGTWIVTAGGMPLELDSFTLMSPDSETEKAEPNFFVRLYYGAIRFFFSFFNDYSSSDSSKSDSGNITVWVTSGRDQVNIIKSLVESGYSAEYNTNVNVQLVPATVVLPATLSGNGPDAVTNIPYTSVIDYAMRNALVDISKLKGFKEEKEKYYSSAIDSVSYQGGCYGLPETQSFPIMFCRDDILKELGIEVPKTWDEFEQALSELNSRNYDVHVSGIVLYPTLVYQYGGNLYEGKGNDYGISTGLESVEAMTAFKQLTKLFTTYNIPVVSDFPNRFRSGEMPIGIADYTTYNTLELFAPEIKGQWSMYQLPGVVGENGKINNCCVSTTTNTIILKDTDNLEAVWKFVKWWHRDNIQLSYANQLEALLGTSGRYSTASINVVKKLKWETGSLNALQQQFKATVATPMVPGNYMTTRMIANAYNEVVTSSNSVNPREALYLKLKTINEELTKKRKEFGLSWYDDNKTYVKAK